MYVCVCMCVYVCVCVCVCITSLTMRWDHVNKPKLGVFPPNSLSLKTGVVPSLSTGRGAKSLIGGQMAERLGSRAINQTVVGSIPGRAK